MPIITPAFPSMCSTHTVMHSTLNIMKEEFERADDILNGPDGLLTGKKTWADLFARHTFFTKDHKYYLSVVASSRSEEAHSTFSGLVQSKFRLLCKGIEEGQCGIEVARPFMKGTDRVHQCENEDEVVRVTQGATDYQIPASKVSSIVADGDNAKHIIYTTTFYIGLTLKAGMLITNIPTLHR
jgi:poly(A) polymerase